MRKKSTAGAKPDGVHVVKARLAGGARVEYHYAWRGGPRIDGQPGSPEYLRSLAAHLESLRTGGVGEPRTLKDLVTLFKASPEYMKLGKDSKRGYETYFPAIITEFGDLPIAALEDKRVRRHFLKWRNTMADTPRAADYGIGTLKRVLSWSVDATWLDTNQAEPIGRLHSVDKSDDIVSDETLTKLATVASAQVMWAVNLALYSGLRECNLVRVAWPNYDGTSISYRTSKRGKDVLIPVIRPGRELLSSLPRLAITILTNTRGRPWTPDGLRTSLSKAIAAWNRANPADPIHITFHALRRTACTKLLIWGLKVPTVAMIMGWSEADVEAMKKKYVSRKKLMQETLAMMGEGG